MSRRRTISPQHYRRASLAQVDGLGFSLKPPKWLREGAKKLFGTVEATVPTSGGAVVVSGGKVSYQPNQPPPEQAMQQTVMTMLPIVGIGLAALLLLRRR